MRILSEKKAEKQITIRAESVDDLWELSNIIEPGDIVKAKTERKIVIGDKQVRKPMVLTINVEKTELQNEILRISGTITEGPDTYISYGDHHTISIQPNQELTITKNWDEITLQRIQKAINKKDYNLLIILFDREEAIIAEINKRGHNLLSHIKAEVEKKREGGGKQTIHEIIAQKINSIENKYDNIIAASPAFWTEYLKKKLPPETLQKTIFTNCGEVNISQINNILTNTEIKKTLQGIDMQQEAELIEELLHAIHKEKACYGEKEVIEEINQARIKKLIVSTDYIQRKKEQGDYEQVKQIIETAKQNNAETKIIEHNKQQLNAIGGIAGIRRW